jgi:transposase
MDMVINPLIVKALRPLTAEEYADLRDMLAPGLHVPLLFCWIEGVPTLLDGHHRYRICLEDGHAVEWTCIETVTTVEQAVAWVKKYQSGRRNQTEEELAALRLERMQRVAAARTEGQTLQAIADKEEVSVATVQSALRKADLQGCKTQPEDGQVTSKDGKKRPAKQPRKKKEELAAPAESQAETDLAARHAANMVEEVGRVTVTLTPEQHKVLTEEYGSVEAGVLRAVADHVDTDGCVSRAVAPSVLDRLSSEQRAKLESWGGTLEDSALLAIELGLAVRNITPKKGADLRRKAHTENIGTAVGLAIDNYLVPSNGVVTLAEPKVKHGTRKGDLFLRIDAQGNQFWVCETCHRKGGMCDDCRKRNGRA